MRRQSLNGQAEEVFLDAVPELLAGKAAGEQPAHQPHSIGVALGNALQ